MLHRALLLVVHRSAALLRVRLARSRWSLLLLVLLLGRDHAGVLEDLAWLRSGVLVRVDRPVRVVRCSSVRLRVSLPRAWTDRTVACARVLLGLLRTATARGHTLTTVWLNRRTTGLTQVLAVLRRLRVVGRVAVLASLGHTRGRNTRRVLGTLLRLARGRRPRTTGHRRRTRRRLGRSSLRLVVLLLLMKLLLLPLLLFLLLLLLLLMLMGMLLLLGRRLRTCLLLGLLWLLLLGLRMMRQMLGRLVMMLLRLLLLLLHCLLLGRGPVHLLHLRLHPILRSAICCLSIVGPASLGL